MSAPDVSGSAGRRRALALLARAWSVVPGAVRQRVLRGLVRLEGEAPDAHALPNLLLLVEPLEVASSHAAMRREGGIHPKHRLMRYHDFFTDRIGPGDTVVDVGCGIGAVAYSIAERTGARVYGIDIDPRSVAEARARHVHPRLHFAVGDALEELPAAQCDVVVLSNVLEHIAQRPAFLRRLAQRLRPSRMLLRVPVSERHWSVPLRRELGLPSFNDPTHHAEHPAEGWLAEFREGGLVPRHQECRWGELWCECGVGA